MAEDRENQDKEIRENQPITFQTHFTGIMEMYSDSETVCNYLNDHRGWFVRCAEPMKAIPYGENGYTLIIGHYGAFGYNVEPQMSVILEPPRENHYTMYSISNPEFNHSGYQVNYRSEMTINPIPITSAAKGIEKAYHRHKISPPEIITRINWCLDLFVTVSFPPFIYKLPMSVIYDTGDRLLRQIVKQVSPRLSYKVQKDFHSRFNLPIPPANARTCQPLQTPDKVEIINNLK